MLADGDLYVAIGRLINSDVRAQTWGCQLGYARSYCVTNQPRVLNIKTITTPLDQWANTKDHSKWCMAENLNSYVVCIADMNRSTQQYNRHGGALCLSHQGVKEAFKSFVTDVEQCNTLNIMDLLNPNTDCDPLDD